MIPDSFLEALRARLSLTTVIGQYVKLTKKGPVAKGLCPFHTEKTPSFVVDEAKGSYHCFGCGAHGDLFEFVRRHQNLSFLETIKTLADQAGLSLPQENFEEKPASRTLKNLLEYACQWFQDHLGRTLKAQEYLTQRGITPSEIKAFRIGWAPGQGLIKDCLAQGYAHADLEQVGLIGRGEGGEYYEWFRQRLIFPIPDEGGRIIAFGGRSLEDRGPKYLNSPETPFFKKGECLYTKPLRKPERSSLPWIIVEGYFDVIATMRIGPAAAPLGTALTPPQLHLIWKKCPEPVICFDGDEAGQKASLKAALMALPLLKPGYSLSFLTLPEGYDPHSFLRQHGEASFRQLMLRAVPLWRYLWEKLFHSSLTPERRAAAIAQWKGWAQMITDREIRKGYERLLYENRKARAAESSPKVPSISLLPQKILLGLLVLNPFLIEHLREELASMTFLEANFWLTLRDSLLSWTKEFPLLDHLSHDLGQEWQSQLQSVAHHIPRQSDPSSLESYWRDLFNAYQTQVHQKEEISSLAHDLFEDPKSWERLRALTTL